MRARTQSRRALTLIELLLSLGLLAAILGVSAGWITISGRQAALASGPLRWEALAQAALRSIEDDLMLGDFEIGGSDAERLARRKARVQVGESRLTVKGRGAGGVPGTFAYRIESGYLVRSSGAQEMARLLVPIARFDAQIEAEHEFIAITLVSDDGREITRRHRVQ